MRTATSGARGRADAPKMTVVPAWSGSDDDLVYVPIELIHEDRSLTRESDPARVSYLKANWDARACGTIILFRRADGNLYLGDGVHRYKGALAAKAKVLPCRIIDGLTFAEQSAIVEKMAKRRQETPVHLYHLRVRAGVPEDVALSVCLAQTGWCVATKTGGPWPAAHGHRTINAIKALIQIHRLGSTLPTLRTLASLDDQTSRWVNNVVVSSLGTFWAAWSDADPQRVAAVMLKHSPQDFVSASKSAGVTAGLGRSAERGALVIVAWYNHRLGAAHCLDIGRITAMKEKHASAVMVAARARARERDAKADQ